MHCDYAQGFADALRVCAELEMARRRERQADGIAKARAAGAYKGRPPSIDRAAIQRLHAEGLNPAEIARRVGCGRASVYRVLQATLTTSCRERRQSKSGLSKMSERIRRREIEEAEEVAVFKAYRKALMVGEVEQQPMSPIHAELHGGVEYVDFGNVHGTFALFRVEEDGGFTRMPSEVWPEAYRDGGVYEMDSRAFTITTKRG